MQEVKYYQYCFSHLRRDAKKGGAPHKPILLLAIISLFESGLFKSNRIYILPELVAAFKDLWHLLVKSNHDPRFALPFFHMNSEPFWEIVPNPGCEGWIENSGSMRHFNNLKAAVAYAVIEESLAKL